MKLAWYFAKGCWLFPYYFFFYIETSIKGDTDQGARKHQLWSLAQRQRFFKSKEANGDLPGRELVIRSLWYFSRGQDSKCSMLLMFTETLDLQNKWESSSCKSFLSSAKYPSASLEEKTVEKAEGFNIPNDILLVFSFWSHPIHILQGIIFTTDFHLCLLKIRTKALNIGSLFQVSRSLIG